MNILFFIRFSVFLMAFASSLFAKCDLSICAILQNEGPFLKEWIEFHKLQGVAKFYLYNNNSTDNYLEVLEPYIMSNEVELIEWPFTYEEGNHGRWIEIQSGAYMDCIKTYGDKTKWLAAIDVDEYLFCPQGEKLPEFLKNYDRYAGLCVNWVMFGTSDVEDIPPDFCLIELLTHCAKQNYDHHHFVKSIVRPEYVSGCTSAHIFTYKEQKYAVDGNKRKLDSPRSESIELDKIRINHYWTRTKNYLLKNKIESRQRRRPHFSTDIIMKMAEDYNQIEDLIILRYLDDLRSAMGFVALQAS